MASQRSYANAHTDTISQDRSRPQFCKADPRNKFPCSLSIKEPWLHVFEDAGLQHAAGPCHHRDKCQMETAERMMCLFCVWVQSVSTHHTEEGTVWTPYTVVVQEAQRSGQDWRLGKSSVAYPQQSV